MLNLFCLIVFCTLIAMCLEKKSKNYGNVYRALIKADFTCWALISILFISLILFSGLRTTYNDTFVYIETFQVVDGDMLSIDMLLNPYGGFEFLMYFIKKYVSIDYRFFLLTTSIIINVIYLWFISKHSKKFSISIICYFIFGDYLFTMAGVKQALAMSLSLIGIDALIRDKKSVFILFIIIASLFHPYIVCLLVIPFFTKEKIGAKTLLIIGCMVIALMNLDVLIGMARLIGKDYTIDEMITHTINPIRVVVEFIPIFYLMVGKKKLDKENNDLFNLGINMMLVNYVLIFMGLFFSPIYFSRIGTYFSVINIITIPHMLNVLYRKHKNKVINLLLYYAVFTIYFFLDVTKLGSISIFTDLFNHVL